MAITVECSRSPVACSGRSQAPWADSQPLPSPPQVVTSVVSQSGVNADAAERIDCNVSHLLESLSACERILSTPIPLSYTRHTARFLLIWLLLLPFSLYPLCGWTMVPIAAILVFLLLGIEEIGVQIEVRWPLLGLFVGCVRPVVRCKCVVLPGMTWVSVWIGW